MSIDVIRKNLEIACQRAYSRGLQTGSGGNVSARIPGSNTMLVTASGGSFGDSFSENFIITDFDGNIVSGDKSPTREVLLHGHIYKTLPDAKAVVHTHSPYAITVASKDSKLEKITWHSQLKLPAPVAIVDIDAAVVPPSNFSIITDVLTARPGTTAFILKGHGIVAIDNVNAVEAEHTAELIEETAQISFLTRLIK